MISVDRLTDEQQAIVSHVDGPALVFAVAGAGKTTSMVHRIRYLVKARGVAADRILASSFSRATVSDVEAALEAVGVPNVDVRTLHSLGFRLIRRAEAAGHLPPRSRRQTESPDVLAQILASRARTHLAVRRSIDTYELGIDADDLLDQIAAWKQQLAYADLDAANLPASALQYASEATHANEDYLTLYRIYEKMRRQEGWITFDDMLLEGWEALLRFPDVRAEAQSDYDHVVVDEFQDVSRVQAQILDVLTAPHRNYMAIGDDDQCIYEWRGANPSFILDFRDTYDAEEYLITDSFRSTLSQVALANAVIAQNENRREKRLHLTRSEAGTTTLRASDGPHGEAVDLVDAVETHLSNGRSVRDLVVLVRTYAQTPFIEHVLIHREIPYRIVGQVPFYRRREVKTLLQYLYWAVLERRLDQNGWFDRRREAARYVDRFERILKRPNRYVKHDLVERISRETLQRQTSALDVLVSYVPQMHDRTTDHVADFLDVVEGLVARLDHPAQPTLNWLVDALDYEAYLRDRSAIAEVGEARVRTARAFVAFADGHASTESLLDEIVRISFPPDDEPDDDEWLDIRSIHRAKGGEWPVVFVPGCNDGILPQRATRCNPTEDEPSPSDESDDGGVSFDDYLDAASSGDDLSDDEREEERRLLYVAVTRARERLVLSYDRHHPVSPFLERVDVAPLLETCERVQAALHTTPDDLSDADLGALCEGVATLGLDRFVREWWNPSDDHRQTLHARLEALREPIKTAQAAMESYAERIAERESILDDLRDNHAADQTERPRERAHEPTSRPPHRDRRHVGFGPPNDSTGTIPSLRAQIGDAGIPIANEHPNTFFPTDATFRFQWTDDTDVVATWNGERVGVVDAFQSSRLTPQVLLSMPWDDVVARFERVGRGRSTVFATVDWHATMENYFADEAASPETSAASDRDRWETLVEDADVPPEPDAPDALTQTLASDACAAGWNVLHAATAPVSR